MSATAGSQRMLTEDQAYRAMLRFLEDVQSRFGSDDLAALLGGFSLRPDGTTMDPAAAADWRDAVAQALARSG